MTKKILAIILAALMVAALAACTNGNNGGESTTDGGTINVGNNESNNGTETEPDETGSEVQTPDNVEAPGELDYVESTGFVYILHKNGAVNLRKADNSIFKSFPNGTKFQKIAVSEDGSVTKVVYEGEQYYIYSTGVTTLENLDEGFVEESKTLVLATDSLKIRIAPDYENTHEAIGFYQKGQEVKVIAVNVSNPEEPWYKVEFVAYGGETKTGYVSASAKHYVQETETTETTDAE
ncbi:MAG: hypothetical protein E7649_04850 [Ruminococcaceae bacterium]|nr:hypothetical protein [Oscillospiraceae bacterium]